MDPPLCGLTFMSHNGSRRPTQPCRHRPRSRKASLAARRPGRPRPGAFVGAAPPGAGAGGAMEGPAIRAPLGADDHQGPARGRRQRGSGAAAPLAVGAQQQWGATRAPRCAPGARPALVTARRGRGAASGSVVPAGGHACRTAAPGPVEPALGSRPAGGSGRSRGRRAPPGAGPPTARAPPPGDAARERSPPRASAARRGRR